MMALCGARAAGATSSAALSRDKNDADTDEPHPHAVMITTAGVVQSQIDNLYVIISIAYHRHATQRPCARSDFRERDLALRLVLALLVAVRRGAGLVALEEEDLRDPLVRVDLRGNGRRVGDLERRGALPLRL